MRRTIVFLTLFSSVRLFGQNCVTFISPEFGTLYGGSSITGLLLQPDGSYTAITSSISPPFSIQNLVPKFNNYLGSCVTPPSSIGLPSVAVSPSPAGAGSQGVAFGYFVDTSSIPGAAYTETASPEPHISVGVITSGAGKVTTYPVPNGAATVAVADFNNDGHQDLAVVYTGSLNATGETAGGVAILLGNGDGTFQPAVSYPAGENSLHVAIADINGDGKLDMVVSADVGASVTVLLGNGDGTFRTGSTITAGLGYGPDPVILADFNNDGKLDMAVGNEDGTISILQGNGDGTFKAPQNIKVCGNCSFLAAGDFNKDGKLDIAANDLTNNLVIVILGNGDGTFGTPAKYFTTNFPTGMILTDFNGDGNLDIVTGSGTPGILTADFGSGNISVLLGNGDGTFQGGLLYPAGGRTASIAAADLNGDGMPDIVSASQQTQSLNILLNQGKGTFKSSTYSYTSATATINPVSVALADLNGDGKIDAAAADDSGTVAVSFGNGDGTFQPATYYATASNSVMVLAGDLNGDGKPDLVVANGPSSLPGSVSILLGSGGGAFKPATSIPTGDTTNFIALSDLNGDGKLDLVVLNNGTLGQASDPGGLMIFLGKGDGTFQAPVSVAAGNNPSALAVGDVNGDGKPDLVVATYDLNFNDYVDVFLGNGDGTFKSPMQFGGSFGMSDIVIADMNGDHKPDIVLASCCGDTEMAYLLGNGDGTFQPQVVFNGGPSSYAMAVADFNSDGKPDLAIADGGDSSIAYVAVLLNTTVTSAFTTALSTAGQVEPFASDTIVSAYGTNLAAGTLVATTLPLGTSLDGTSVTITDSAGGVHQALLFFVSATQVNYEIPDDLPSGLATVVITNKNGTKQTGTIQIGAVSPGLFELNGAGLAAALVLPVVNGVQQSLQQVYQLNSSQAVVPLPIDVSAANTQIYLELYGTGIRNAKNVTVTVGGIGVPVLYSNAAPGYAGEDQINIGPLPVSLAGKGSVNIILTADGQVANTVNVTIQ